MIYQAGSVLSHHITDSAIDEAYGNVSGTPIFGRYVVVPKLRVRSPRAGLQGNDLCVPEERKVLLRFERPGCVRLFLSESQVSWYTAVCLPSFTKM